MMMMRYTWERVRGRCTTCLHHQCTLLLSSHAAPHMDGWITVDMMDAVCGDDDDDAVYVGEGLRCRRPSPRGRRDAGEWHLLQIYRMVRSRRRDCERLGVQSIGGRSTSASV